MRDCRKTQNSTLKVTIVSVEAKPTDIRGMRAVITLCMSLNEVSHHHLLLFNNRKSKRGLVVSKTWIEVNREVREFVADDEQ